MSNNNNSNSNNNRRRGPPRPFPFNTQPMANDPIWREYGYSMPNENEFQLAQSYPATPNRGTLEYTVPPSPPRLVRSRGFLRNRSESINSTATTNPEPVPLANILAAIPESNNESVNMLPENENAAEASNTSNNSNTNNSENENPRPLKKGRFVPGVGGKRKTRRRAQRKRKTQHRRRAH
jgi:hypothetical protein